MRCVFCYFAEDIELLPSGLFKRTLETARTAGGPERVAAVLTSLWQTMDQGASFGADLIRRFNGHFCRTVDALPLETVDVTLLIQAADFDWSRVEPSIFGTLLVRALDPAERHRLGAEYTPREYIELLVEPTVVEPRRPSSRRLFNGRVATHSVRSRLGHASSHSVQGGACCEGALGSPEARVRKHGEVYSPHPLFVLNGMYQKHVRRASLTIAFTSSTKPCLYRLRPQSVRTNL